MSTIAMGRRGGLPTWGLVLGVAMILEIVYFSLTNHNFFGHGTGLLGQVELFLPTGILAVGLAVVVLTGNIDLSAGSVASLSSVIVGKELLAGHGIAAAVLVAVGVSALVGLVNGVIVALAGIDSLLVTLATQFIAGSVAVSLAGDSPPQGFPHAFTRLGSGRLAGVPVSLVIFLAIGILTAVMVTRTGFGRRLVLIGHNAAAARYSGVRVPRTLIGVFTFSGLVAGIGGVTLAAYYNAGRADSGMALLLPAITCVVLGGVDIFGGNGRVGEVIVAVLLLGLLTQGMLNSGYSSLTTTMVTGLLLIVGLVIKIAFEKQSEQSILAAIADRLRGLISSGGGARREA